MSHWVQLTLTVQDNQAESFEAHCDELGALAVTYQDAGDDALYQESLDTPLLWTHTQASVLFDAHCDQDAITTALSHALSLQPDTCRWDTIPDKDWVRDTQQQFPIQHINGLTILPHHDAHTDDIKPPMIRLDPGLAFGTGTHPTTQLCLEWITSQLSPHSTVIDFGCGSGILALSALAMGADTVWAIDHDPQALEATQHNASLNQFTGSLQVGHSSTHPLPIVDAVIANILATPLVSLVPTLTSAVRPGGHLVLSGLLITDKERLINAYAPWPCINTAISEEWISLTFKAPNISSPT